MKEEKAYLTNLLKENDTIVIGCSGGPDSMCLLNLLLELQNQYHLKIIVAHINHQLRKESDEELVFVNNYCKKNHILFESMKIEEYPKNHFSEASARKIRQQFFQEIIFKYQANYLMTAHHGDDLTETILMRLVRGSNLSGYAGFKREKKELNYVTVKPLITTTKDKILKYVDKYKIPFVVDASNESENYTRNRYRKNILPFLKKENPKVNEKFLKYSQELCRIDEFLVKLTESALTDCIRNDTLHIAELKELDPYLQQRVLESYLKKIYRDEISEISAKHLQLLVSMIANPKSNLSVNLPKGFQAKKSYNNFKIEKDNKVLGYQIELKEETNLPNGGTLIMVEKEEQKNNFVLRLNRDEITFPLIVRTRLDGDKITLKNRNGHKKIKDIFMDEKVPKDIRDKYPLLVDTKGEILWIPGIKKSKFDKEKNEKYDIIIKYVLSKEKKNDKKK